MAVYASTRYKFLMVMSARKRNKIGGLLIVGVLSSATMLWLIWHYPVATGLATLIVLSALEISARLSRWIDTDSSSSQRRSV